MTRASYCTKLLGSSERHNTRSSCMAGIRTTPGKICRTRGLEGTLRTPPSRHTRGNLGAARRLILDDFNFLGISKHQMVVRGSSKAGSAE